jgi:uncharacterized membrane protein (UPF0127 family)
MARLHKVCLHENPDAGEDRYNMGIEADRPMCLNILKTCLWFVFVFLLNTVPFVHACNAASDAQVAAMFLDGTGRELCRFKVELAVTPEEQSRGLMFRKNLASDGGMLFVNKGDELRSFWMKNTYIPLDILFINSSNEVKHIQYGAKPLDETSIHSQYPVQYVLEVNAGKARKCNIRQGTKMSILHSPR